MNAKKQYPNDKLQKSSILFLQLGLILALTGVYYILEIETPTKKLADYTSNEANVETFPYPLPPPVIKIETEEPIVKKEKKKEFSKTEIITKENPTEKTPTILEPEPTTNKSANNIIEGLPDITDPVDEDPIPFIILERAPIFPGCENLDTEKAKTCFTKKISKFVSKRFDTGLAEELGLSGKQSIYVQFLIDKTGKVTDIKARASHKRLEKEAIKVIEKLPQMTPGKQRTRAVSVKYTLPIKFNVY